MLRVRIKSAEEHTPEMAVELNNQGGHIYLEATDHEGNKYVLCEITGKGLEIWEFAEGKNWPTVNNGEIAVYDNSGNLLNKVEKDD